MLVWFAGEVLADACLFVFEVKGHVESSKGFRSLVLV